MTREGTRVSFAPVTTTINPSRSVPRKSQLKLLIHGKVSLARPTGRWTATDKGLEIEEEEEPDLKLPLTKSRPFKVYKLDVQEGIRTTEKATAPPPAPVVESTFAPVVIDITEPSGTTESNEIAPRKMDEMGTEEKTDSPTRAGKEVNKAETEATTGAAPKTHTKISTLIPVLVSFVFCVFIL
jgi:hypothetical protein